MGNILEHDLRVEGKDNNNLNIPLYLREGHLLVLHLKITTEIEHLVIHPHLVCPLVVEGNALRHPLVPV